MQAEWIIAGMGKNMSVQPMLSFAAQQLLQSVALLNFFVKKYDNLYQGISLKC